MPLPEPEPNKDGKTWFTVPPRGEMRVVLCFRSDDDQIMTTTIRLDRWSATSIMIGNAGAIGRDIQRQFGTAFMVFAKGIYERFGLGRTEGKQGEVDGQSAQDDKRLPRPEPSGDRHDE